MNFKIDQSESVNHIKARFSNLYPYLKIEFFSSAHQQGEGSAKKELIDKDLTLDELGGMSGEVTLEDNTTVSDFESEFRNTLGLNIQVFRKSGNIWIETTTTDSWTLKEQNNHAYEKK